MADPSGKLAVSNSAEAETSVSTGEKTEIKNVNNSMAAASEPPLERRAPSPRPEAEQKEEAHNDFTTTPVDPPGNEDGDDDEKDPETATDATADSDKEPQQTAVKAIVSSSKKSRPPYKYDPDKITLRFLFANRDGLTVTVDCKPSDTVGEVKGALISVWPKDVPDCGGGDSLRLICMGKGYLTPDSRTLEDCQIPIFKTHPTPINVSVKPGEGGSNNKKSKSDGLRGRGGSHAAGDSSTGGGGGGTVSQGCGCIIQ